MLINRVWETLDTSHVTVYAVARSNRNSWWLAKMARTTARIRDGCIHSALTT